MEGVTQTFYSVVIFSTVFVFIYRAPPLPITDRKSPPGVTPFQCHLFRPTTALTAMTRTTGHTTVAPLVVWPTLATAAPPTRLARTILLHMINTTRLIGSATT